eukprot:m.372241 g.372241  ORF g.372241 m.372241 type:complete len:117 (-) comp28143_c0_seq4:1419-1769(-)
MQPSSSGTLRPWPMWAMQAGAHLGGSLRMATSAHPTRTPSRFDPRIMHTLASKGVRHQVFCLVCATSRSKYLACHVFMKMVLYKTKIGKLAWARSLHTSAPTVNSKGGYATSKGRE